MNESGNNWSKLASKFAFAHNTSVNYTIGQTPYEIVFGTKPHVPMTLNSDYYETKINNAKLNSVMDSNLIHTVKTACRITPLTAYFDHSFPTSYQNKKTNSNEFTRQPIRDAVTLRQKHTSTETDLNSDDLSAVDKKCS